jgi:hypothetical protein
VDEKASGEHFVAQVVERGYEFALGGSGAGRFKRVDAIGGDLFVGCHDLCPEEKKRGW